jgi:hypothetical protein
MSKQTAVDVYHRHIRHLIAMGLKLSEPDKTFLNSAYRDCKAMEKQQSISDYCEGFKASGEGWNGEYGLTDMLDVAGEIDAEGHYNRTYKGDDK